MSRVNISYGENSPANQPELNNGDTGEQTGHQATQTILQQTMVNLESGGGGGGGGTTTNNPAAGLPGLGNTTGSPKATLGNNTSSGNDGGPVVTPNPVFVPPGYVDDGYIKITMSSQDDAQFLENGINVGIGRTITLKRTSLEFGAERSYRSVRTGKQSKNYFTVGIEKKHTNENSAVNKNDDKTVRTTTGVNTNSLSFTYNTDKPTGYNDYLYEEILSVKEYELNKKTNEFYFVRETKLRGNVGVINLAFTFGEIPYVPPKPMPVEYEFKFISNFISALGTSLSLKYEIELPSGQIIDSGKFSLEKIGTGTKKIDYNLIKDGKINLKIVGTVLPDYSYRVIYYKKLKAPDYISPDSSVGWKEVASDFSIPARELDGGGIVVNAIFDRKKIIIPKPQISLTSREIDKEVKDSDRDAMVNVGFKSTNTEFVDLYLSDKEMIRVNSKDGYIPLSFVKNFNKVFGKKKVILVPFSNAYGSGDRYEVIINFISKNDFPSITQIIFPTDVQIPTFSDGDLDWEITYDSISTTSVDVDLYTKSKKRISLFKNLPKKRSFQN